MTRRCEALGSPGRYRQELPGFVAYLEAAGASTVTVDLAVSWARLPGRIKPITVSYRLSAMRGFAHYLHALDPGQPDPRTGVTRGHAAATGALPVFAGRGGPAAGDDPAAPATAAGAVCGFGKALALTRDDVDLANGVITIRHAKFDRVRLVPLHLSVTAALRDYATTRDRLCPGGADRPAVPLGSRPRAQA